MAPTKKKKKCCRGSKWDGFFSSMAAANWKIISVVLLVFCEYKYACVGSCFSLDSFNFFLFVLNFCSVLSLRINPLTAEWTLRALIDFTLSGAYDYHRLLTLSNARRFYSSMGNPLAGKGLDDSRKEMNERARSLSSSEHSAPCQRP